MRLKCEVLVEELYFKWIHPSIRERLVKKTHPKLTYNPTTTTTPPPPSIPPLKRKITIVHKILTVHIVIFFMLTKF